MQTFTLRRLDTDGLSTIGRWFAPDGTPLCYGLEPGMARLPHPGIIAGVYPLRLRTIGDKNAVYLSKFGPAFHKGMIEIAGVPCRDAIEFHIGNSLEDTLGCSLAGEVIVLPKYAHSGHWEVQRSEAAYRAVYPVLRDAILAGPAQLQVLPNGATA